MRRNNLLTQTGATYVEAAISIVIFLAIMFAIIELLTYSFVNISMQHVLNESIRQAVVGDLREAPTCSFAYAGAPEGADIAALPAALTPAIRGQCIQEIVRNQAERFGISVELDDVIVNAVGLENFTTNTETQIQNTICGGGTANAGEGGDFLSICIRRTLTVVPGITADREYFTIARNEGFRFI